MGGGLMSSDDGASLLRAIWADPEADDPRLAFADWLQETDSGERVPCPNPEAFFIEGRHVIDPPGPLNLKPCPACDGTGTVRDERRQRRAEFIRVQVELARCGPKHRELFVADGAGTRMEGLGIGLTPKGNGHFTFSSLERGNSIDAFTPGERLDIYTDVAGKSDRGVRWLRGLRYVSEVGDPKFVHVVRKDDQSGPWKGQPFAERSDELIRLHGAEWARVPCPTCRNWMEGREDCSACGGTGDALHNRNPQWSRGFVYQVECGTLAEVGGTVPKTCPECQGRPLRRASAGKGFIRCGHCVEGTGRVFRPSPWLAAVVRAHPIVRVVVRDREPYYNAAGCWIWVTTTGGLAADGAVLPRVIYAALRDDVDIMNRGFAKAYRTADAARDALAVAIADVVRAWVRREGGGS